MGKWKTANDTQKSFIVKAARKRFFKWIGIIICVCFIISGVYAVLIGLSYNDEVKSIMRENLWYDPDYPPYKVFPKGTKGFLIFKSEEETEKEIANVRTKAKEQIGNKYIYKGLKGLSVIFGFSFFLIILLYIRFRKELQTSYVFANAVCIQKERIILRYLPAYYISVKIEDGTIVDYVRVGYDLYKQINFDVPLVLIASVENLYFFNKNIDLIFLKKDWENC